MFTNFLVICLIINILFRTFELNGNTKRHALFFSIVKCVKNEDRHWTAWLWAMALYSSGFPCTTEFQLWSNLNCIVEAPPNFFSAFCCLNMHYYARTASEFVS